MTPEPTDALITAMRLDEAGGADTLSPAELKQAWQSDASLLWMHLDFRQDNINELLSTLAEMDPAVIDALLEEEIRPRVARFPGGLVTTLRGVNITPGSEHGKLISLRAWLTPNRLVTLRRQPLDVIQQIHDEFAQHQGATNLTEILARIADHLVDQTGTLLAQMNQSLAQYEEAMLSDSSVTTRTLAQLRRPMIMLNRFIRPQYDCLSRLGDASLQLDEANRITFRESANHLSRYLEDLQAMQDRALMLQEQIWSMHSDRLNSRMYLISVITVLFMPLTFLTGLLGVNVGGIPGASNAHGFLWVLVICLLISFLLTLGIVGFQQLRQRRYRARH
ncbi:CorA family divalent cation transporter [Carnimonas nigrificans]|uniref:CorA family divalent cation transporter n=1 Tax=Carnimonas nigrificans TaxID=64323 RepID=UPI00046EB1CE|nr:CorA family divalent cation transporter [Carnimonas nigrificans]